MEQINIIGKLIADFSRVRKQLSKLELDCTNIAVESKYLSTLNYSMQLSSCFYLYPTLASLDCCSIDGE